MQYLRIIYALLFSFCVAETILAKEHGKSQIFQEQCLADLEFIQGALIDNSAYEASKADARYSKWSREGYIQTKELISAMKNEDDCHFVLNYYVNGFHDNNIRLRSYVRLPEELYPGILSALKGNKHEVIYKNPSIKYLSKVKVGDQISRINDVQIDKYYKEYLLPFYASTNSKIDLTKASLYALIVDGNDFIPTPRTLSLINHKGEAYKLELQYTKMNSEANKRVNRVRNPENKKFRVDLFSGGVWIRIPSFYPTEEEEVYFRGMLASLQELGNKQEYIIFDMRGNRGGSTGWERPILRNLCGDNFIKSLGNKHDYNSKWEKRIRVSKKNLAYFKQFYTNAQIKEFAGKLAKREDFYNIKWDIYSETDNLFTNNENAKIRAKIFVLTDNFCTGTCWLFVREMLQIPGITHIGQTTAIQKPFTKPQTIRLPSERFDFFVPIQEHIFPATNHGKPFIPSIIFEGDINNDSRVADWIIELIDKDRASRI